MPPETRILGLGWTLPAEEVDSAALAEVIGSTAGEIEASTGIARRFRAPEGEGPSDLAARAAAEALGAAGTRVEEVGLILFATATPDVTFPGAACYLQQKIGAPTVGALDLRAQSAGFVAGLDLAAEFAALESPAGGADPRYERILLAAGEVLTSGLDESPAGREMTPRFGDGAAVAVLGRGGEGPRVGPVRWYSEGALAERFWCEYPASRQYPVRMTEADMASGRHFPRADLAGLAPIAADRLESVSREVLEASGWEPGEIDLAIVDYVEPSVARTAAASLGIPPDRVEVPTAVFGHVMAGGLPISLARRLPSLPRGARILLAAAGPGFTYGAATLEA